MRYISCAGPTVGPGRTVGGQAGSAVPWGQGTEGLQSRDGSGRTRTGCGGRVKYPFLHPLRGGPQPSLPPHHTPAHARTHTHSCTHPTQVGLAPSLRRRKNEGLGPWGLSPAPSPQRGSMGKEGRVSDAHASPLATDHCWPLLRLLGRRSRKGREEGAGLGTRDLAASHPPREGGGKLHLETDLVNIKREPWELPRGRLPVA